MNPIYNKDLVTFRENTTQVTSKGDVYLLKGKYTLAKIQAIGLPDVTKIIYGTAVFTMDKDHAKNIASCKFEPKTSIFESE